MPRRLRGDDGTLPAIRGLDVNAKLAGEMGVEAADSQFDASTLREVKPKRKVPACSIVSLGGEVRAESQKFLSADCLQLHGCRRARMRELALAIAEHEYMCRAGQHPKHQQKPAKREKLGNEAVCHGQIWRE